MVPDSATHCFSNSLILKASCDAVLALSAYATGLGVPLFLAPKHEIELIRARLKWAERLHHEKSSDNVFTDLGLPNSEQELLKARLTVQIYKLIKERELTQSNAAQLLGTTQAQVSALMRCRPVSVSIGRLMEFLTVLGQDVEVTVRPSSTESTGDMSVVVQPT